ncbi:hypothetical protein E3P99_01488 [Wallemia hederae]|uniref:Uncharacterized protein n=1 Tax=Wallemia hederae TaxID=1540922 RepID=A0A4T0FPY5_9BASI|nr:hypothetical protein E3P99_01488 [Wallemia hederae]
MGFEVFMEEEEIVTSGAAEMKQTQTPTHAKPATTSILGSKTQATQNMLKSQSAPSKLEGLHKGGAAGSLSKTRAASKTTKPASPKVNARRQALADAAALPPKKAAAMAAKSSVKKTDGMTIDELRRARKAETAKKREMLGVQGVQTVQGKRSAGGSASTSASTSKKAKLSL